MERKYDDFDGPQPLTPSERVERRGSPITPELHGRLRALAARGVGLPRAIVIRGAESVEEWISEREAELGIIGDAADAGGTP
jgi:hypothetical protein